MSAAQDSRSIRPPAWHGIRSTARSRRGDPETFHLHVEFVHAHGIPKGQFTTFSMDPTTEPDAGEIGRSGAHGK